MELLTFHNQLVAFFPSDDQDNNFVLFDIIQSTQGTCPKLKDRCPVWAPGYPARRTATKRL